MKLTFFSATPYTFIPAHAAFRSSNTVPRDIIMPDPPSSDDEDEEFDELESETDNGVVRPSKNATLTTSFVGPTSTEQFDPDIYNPVDLNSSRCLVADASEPRVVVGDSVDSDQAQVQSHDAATEEEFDKALSSNCRASTPSLEDRVCTTGACQNNSEIPEKPGKSRVPPSPFCFLREVGTEASQQYSILGNTQPARSPVSMKIDISLRLLTTNFASSDGPPGRTSKRS